MTTETFSFNPESLHDIGLMRGLVRAQPTIASRPDIGDPLTENWKTTFEAILDYLEAKATEKKHDDLTPPPSENERASYHDLYITTKDIPRRRIFDLGYGLEVRCMRMTGWELWSHHEPMWHDPRVLRPGEKAGPHTETLLASEYGSEGKWLVLDYKGTVIVDSRRDDKQYEDVRYLMLEPVSGRRSWMSFKECAVALDRGWGDGAVAMDLKTGEERPLTEEEKRAISNASDEYSASK